MMRKYVMAFHVPGTLSADLAIVWTAPAGAQLVHVSAVGSNANDGLMTIGTTSNPDAYLESASIGTNILLSRMETSARLFLTMTELPALPLMTLLLF